MQISQRSFFWPDKVFDKAAVTQVKYFPGAPNNFGLTYLKRPLSAFKKASVTKIKYIPWAPNNFGTHLKRRSAFEKASVTKISIFLGRQIILVWHI